MPRPSKKTIAVIGAGPIGLEAALYGAGLGHDVNVYERERVGGHMRHWGHVRLFSPWRMNHSPLGAHAVRSAGVVLPDDDAYLTGNDHVKRYLEPLAASRSLSGRVHEGSSVRQVGRDRIGKAGRIGDGREEFPLRLLVEDRGGERVVEADIVLDCSGTYSNPNRMGSGNLPALGERRLADRIVYTLEDLRGRARDRYAGREVLVVGAGHSACTAVEDLLHVEGTRVIWVARTDRDEPQPVIPDDPLPERARLSRTANDLARGSDPRVTYRKATVVDAVEAEGDRVRVTLRSRGSSTSVVVDRILALVGYSPDNSLYRELQVHECYATFGPMRLAAALLDGDSTDCLSQTAKGPETLRNPEPGFFILGAKSYGTNSNFLIRIGVEQVREVYALIEDRPGLDLYAA